LEVYVLGGGENERGEEKHVTAGFALGRDVEEGCGLLKRYYLGT